MSRTTKNRLAPGVTNLDVRIKEWKESKGTDVDERTKSLPPSNNHYHKPGSQKKSLGRRNKHVCKASHAKRCPLFKKGD
jgi:hypothetical protein